MGLLLTYLLLALSISFICSVAEAVILSIPISFVETKEAEGKKSAKLLKKYKNNIDPALSSILSLNTIAHTIGAAGVGAQAIILFGDASFGIVSAILTFLILVLSEILPKSIGTRYNRALALPTAKTIQVMMFITYPVVLLSKVITKLVSQGKRQQTVSREEVAVLTQIGLQEGVFAEHESKIISNLIKLKSIKANAIMTPRTVVVANSEEDTVADFLKRPDIVTHSRFPIFRGNIDNVTGYVLKLDVVEQMMKGNGNLPLSTIKRPIAICYEGTTIPMVFDILLGQKEQIAIVVDEYGGIEGVITLEDIIETIFGLEIVDEKDRQIDMQEVAKEKWRKRAEKLNIDLTEYNKEEEG